MQRANDDPLRYLRVDSGIINVTVRNDIQTGTNSNASSGIWIPHCSEGFVWATIQEEGDETLRVKLENGEVQEVAKYVCQKANPVKFSKLEDMTVMTCLNEATILCNLRERYKCGLIYTYSGLFCIVTNPYRSIAIYGQEVMEAYKGQHRQCLPPHIFAITDVAYRNMLANRENQSILCTGESGAGKTENTKKVIQYIAYVATAPRPDCIQNRKQLTQSTRKLMIDMGQLEQQLLQAYPILESFGNAKTVKNDNSSRFGKFTRINFDQRGYISRISIDTYLLEKSRTIRQASYERSFHVFYQLLKGADNGKIEEFLLDDIPAYKYLTNKHIDLPGTNDAEEFKNTVTAMHAVGIDNVGLSSIFKLISAILQMGNLEFEQDKNSDNVTIIDDTVAQKIYYLLGISENEFVKSYLRPKLKIGRDHVTKAQSKEQVEFAVEATSKAIYERMFNWIVQRINKTLDRSKRQSAFFIGILDIAGFEIFSVNSFEQLCVNYTNEKMQQLFNQIMFVTEQNEYEIEGIDWNHVDFGLDLQPTIDLIEKRMGIISLLDQECMFPMSTDSSYVEKLKAAHSNHPKFVKPRLNDNHHFSLIHYAGKVDYDVGQWLLKNMDPLNDNVVSLLQASTAPLVREIWKDAEIARMLDTDDRIYHGRASFKQGMFRTVGQTYKEQLCELMKTLRSTQPNFVRCIMPNHEKKPSKFEPMLVLHQLRCNGILEGIRVCRMGFPNRFLFQDFTQRYWILCPEVDRFTDSKMKCECMVKQLEIDAKLYKIGNTKVCFRATAFANLEEERDIKITKKLRRLHDLCKGMIARKRYKRRVEQFNAIHIIQRNGRVLLKTTAWNWWRLFVKVQPLIRVSLLDDELKSKDREIAEMKIMLEKVAAQVDQPDKVIRRLHDEKAHLEKQLKEETKCVDELLENGKRLQRKRQELETTIIELQLCLVEEVQKTDKWDDDRKKFRGDIECLMDELEEKQLSRQELELKETNLKDKLRETESVLKTQVEHLEKLMDEQKVMEERLKESADIQTENRQKGIDLLKIRSKQDSSLTEMVAHLRKEEEVKQKLDQKIGLRRGDIYELARKVIDIEQEIPNVKIYLQQKNKETANAYSKMEETDAANHRYGKEIRELKTELDDITDELEAEKACRLQTERDKTNLAEENEALQNEISSHSDDKAVMHDQLWRRENELASAMRQLKEEQIQREVAIRELKGKLKAKKIEQLNSDLENVKKANSRAACENRSLEDELRILGSEVKSAQFEKNEMTVMTKQFESEVDDATSKLLTLEQSLAGLEEKLTQASIDTDNHHSAATQTEVKLHAVEKNLDRTRKELENSKKTLLDESCQKHHIQTRLRKVEEEVLAMNDMVEDRCSEIVRLEQNNNNLTNTINSLKGQHQSSTSKQLDEVGKTLLREKETLLADIMQWKTQVGRTESSKKKIQNELNDVTVEVHKYRSHCGNLEKAQRNIDRELNDERLEQERLRNNIDLLEKEMRERETKLFSLTYELDERGEALKDSEARVKQLRAELDDALAGKDDVGRNAYDTERTNRVLQQANEEYKQRILELEDEVSVAENARLRSEVNISALKKQLERQLQESNDANDDRHRAAVKEQWDLQTELNKERHTRNAAVMARNKVEMDLMYAESRLSDALNARDDSANQLKRATTNCKELTCELNHVRNLRDETYNVGKEMGERVKKLELLVQQTNQEREMTEGSKRTLVNENDEMIQAINMLKASRLIPVEEKRKLEKRISELEVKINEETSKADLLAQTLSKVTTTLEQAQSDLNVEKSKAESYKALLEKQNRELKQKAIDMEANSRTINKLATTNLENMISALEERLSEEQSEKSKADRMLQQTEKQLRGAVLQSDAGRNAHNNVKGELEKATARVKALKLSADESDEELCRLRNRLKKAQREKAEADNMITLRNQRIKQMESILSEFPRKTPLGKTFSTDVDWSEDEAGSQRSHITFHSRNGSSKEQSPF